MAGAGDDEHGHIRRIHIFQRQRVALWLQARRHCVAAVDGGCVQITQSAGQLGGFELDEFELFGVGRNVQHRGAGAGIGFQRNQTLLGQHQQGARAVRRVVGNAHAGAVLEISQVLDLCGIHAHLLVHRLGHGHEVVATVLVLRIQKRLVLVDVGVDVTGHQRGIGLNEVTKLHQFDLQALLGCHLLGHFGNLRVRAGCDADSDFQILGLHQRDGGQ